MLATALLAAAFAVSGAAEEAGERKLEPGASAVRRLAPGETHRYRLADARAGGETLRAFLVSVEQEGVDVVLSLTGPGEPELVVDSPNGRRGPERLLVRTTPGASYRLEVRAPASDAPAGGYALRLQELPSDTLEERSRIAAWRLMTEAARRYAEGAASRPQALEHYRAACARWTRLGEAAETARCRLHAGILERLSGDHTAALESFGEALALWRRLDDDYQQARTLNEMGFSHWSRGEARRAVELYRQALPLWRATGDLRGEALTLNNLGLAEQTRGDPRAAQDPYLRALELFEQVGDRRRAAVALGSLGGVAEALGDPETARARYLEALELHRELENPRAEAQTLSNLALLERNLGRYQEALERYREALAIQRRAGARADEGRTWNNLGETYLALGDAGRGREALERALELRRAVGDRRGEAYTLHNLGLAARLEGETATALALFEQALELERQVEDRPAEAGTLAVLGSTLAESGRRAEAAGALERALELLAAAEDRRRQAQVLQGLAELDLATGKPARGHARGRRALELARAVGDRPREAQVLVTLAAAERALGRPERSRERVEAALERIEDLRLEVESPELRASFLARRRQAYELQIDLLMERHRRQPAAGHDRQAFAWSERARARGLLDLLGRAAHGVEATFEPLPGDEVRALLAPEDLLLAYSLGEERSYLWTVETDALRAYELPPRDALEEAARRVYRGWSRLDSGRREEREAAAALAELVLEPIADRLAGQRLLIVADGALHYVPFAALPRPGGDPLMVAHEIVHLPSASVLAAQRRRLGGRRRPPGAVAVLADPVFDASDPRLAVAAAATGVVSETRGEVALGRLAWSRAEAEAIAAFSPPEASLVALGFDADLGLVESGRLEEYRVVHFATHGVVDSERPERSALVLSRLDAQGRPRPGRLSLDRVYDLELAADLVVLSGCRTALGREIYGEGLWGLAYGFFHAGARRVAASLWQVRDRSTAELMKRFYEAHLGRGLEPAAALREAQLALRADRRWADPYHWAGFVLYGD